MIGTIVYLAGYVIIFISVLIYAYMSPPDYINSADDVWKFIMPCLIIMMLWPAILACLCIYGLWWLIFNGIWFIVKKGKNRQTIRKIEGKK